MVTLRNRNIISYRFDRSLGNTLNIAFGRFTFGRKGVLMTTEALLSQLIISILGLFKLDFHAW